MSNPAKMAQRKAERTRELLAETFPKCFARKGEEKRPLAIGLHQEILGAIPEIGYHRLSAALADYTSGPTYLRNVVEGAPRVGLDGEPKGVVTAKEATHAATRLASWRAWASSRKELQAAQRHAAIAEFNQKSTRDMVEKLEANAHKSPGPTARLEPFEIALREIGKPLNEVYVDDLDDSPQAWRNRCVWVSEIANRALRGENPIIEMGDRQSIRLERSEIAAKDKTGGEPERGTQA
jgi:ProP effector